MDKWISFNRKSPIILLKTVGFAALAGLIHLGEGWHSGGRNWHIGWCENDEFALNDEFDAKQLNDDDSFTQNRDEGGHGGRGGVWLAVHPSIIDLSPFQLQ